jgi:hypothetical protein
MHSTVQDWNTEGVKQLAGPAKSWLVVRLCSLNYLEDDFVGKPFRNAFTARSQGHVFRMFERWNSVELEQ